jgi:hypothetical protein
MAKLPQLLLQAPPLSHIFNLLYQHHRVSVDVCGCAMQHSRRIEIRFIRCQQQAEIQRVVK